MTPAPRTGPRQATFRLLALVMAAFWGFFFFGLIDLLAFAAGPDFHTSLMLSTGWGLVVLFLVAAPLLAVGMRPQSASPAALGLVAAVAAAVAAGALLSGSVPHLTVAAGLAATAVLIVAAGDRRRAMWRASWRRSAVPMVLVAGAAVPWSAYAWAAARSTGANPVASDTWGLDHWPIQAALPVALLLGAALAAGHPSGWVVPTWCVGAATVWLAVVSWFEPHLAGSLGRPWAAVAGPWAMGFVASTHVCAGRADATLCT